MNIAINGAGVAGPALAFWLQREGHRITLIEKAPRFRTGGYVIDFWGVGYRVAEKMGLLPQIREAGYSVREVRLVGDDGQRTEGFNVDLIRRMTHDEFTSLPRGDLAEVISRNLPADIETRFDDTITAIQQHESGVEITLKDGGARQVDLVVGADGLHSRVRELVFGPESQFERPLGYHVAAFEAEGYKPRDELTYVAHAVAGRQVARFSLRNNRTMFLFVFADEWLRDRPIGAPGAGRKVLHSVFENAGWECPQILAAMDRADDVYFDRVSQIHCGRWSEGRVALIGDAAFCVSLLAGEGTGLALTAAYVLAGELKRAGDNFSEAFRSYEDRLRSFIEGKQQATRRFASAFAPKTAAGVWFRNVVSRILNVPLIAKSFIGKSIVDDFELPDYGL